jgi:hypothetical protein
MSSEDPDAPTTSRQNDRNDDDDEISPSRRTDEFSGYWSTVRFLADAFNLSIAEYLEIVEGENLL